MKIIKLFLISLTEWKIWRDILIQDWIKDKLRNNKKQFSFKSLIEKKFLEKLGSNTICELISNFWEGDWPWLFIKSNFKVLRETKVYSKRSKLFFSKKSFQNLIKWFILVTFLIIRKRTAKYLNCVLQVFFDPQINDDSFSFEKCIVFAQIKNFLNCNLIWK